MLRQLLPRLTAILVPALVALVIHACADATGPSGGVIPTGPRIAFSVTPSFQTPGPAGIVQFVKVRVVIRRADGSIALDELVDFPADADEVSLTFNVPLSPTAPATGEPLAVNLEMLNAAGEVVFRGGPISVTATQGTPLPPVNVPTTYTGPGATAQSVTLSAPTTTLAPGDGVNLVARAFDQNNVELPGTPVQYSSTNPAVLRVPNPTVPVAEAVARGSASIRATLVTGQSTELAFVVRPPATNLAVVSGTPQTGGLGTALAQPLRVRVTAADGLGVEGIAVNFAAVAGGGSPTEATVVTDESGEASVGFTVGSQLGPVTVRATTTALPTATADFAITAVPGPAAALRFVSQPVGGRSDEVMAPFAVEALDAFGNRATSFTGEVTVALEGGAAIVIDGAELMAATLAGTFRVSAVAGLATFAAVRVDGAVSGARFRASATGLTSSITSEPFTVSPLAATVLNLITPPANGKTGNVIRVVADARNSRNEVVPAYVGTMVATIASGPQGGVIVAADRVAFVNGVASLDLVVNLPGVYQLNLTASGLTPIITPTFTVATSDVTTLELVAGPGSIVAGGSTHTASVMARDGSGDLVANVNVQWTVTSGGGSVASSSSLTTAEGVASTQWTVGASGAQTLKAAVGSVELTLSTALSVAPATLRTWNGITSDDWHTASNWTPASVPTAAEDVMIPALTPNAPIVRAAASARHLTVSAGASLYLDYADLQVSGNVLVGASGVIAYGYSLDQESAPGNGVLNLRRGTPGNIVLSEYETYGGLIMIGANTTISAAAANLDVNVTVRNVVRAATALTLGECLYIETDLGIFDPNGYTVVIHGDMETYYGGRLRMQSAASIIEVHQEAYFGGGNTTGLLTAGELRLYGSLYQNGYGYSVGIDESVQRARSLVTGPASTSRGERRLARQRGARRALLTAGDTESGLATPANFETSGTHKTRFICTPDSPSWTGESCYSQYIEFTHPSESKQQNLSFEGFANWYSYGGIRVIGALKLMSGAQLYDYYGAAGLTAGLQGAERTRALNDARLAQGRAALAAPETERIGERSSVYGSACNYRLCIDGTLEGDATTTVYFDQLLLKGTIVGSLALDVYRLQMHGTNQVLSQVTNPGLSFEELRVFGTVSLVPGETVQSYYYGSAGVYSGGVLDINGATLDLDYYGTFRTVDAGVVIMDDPNSTIVAGSGDFSGGVSTLSAGTIRLGNSFTQSGTANAFDATGSHTVVFGTTAAYGAISFGTPGPSSGTSHFANLRFDGGSTVTLNSTVYVNGTLSVDDNVGSLTMYGNAHRLEVGGINIPGAGTQVRFVRVQVRVGSTGPLVLNNAVFEQFDAIEYEDQLTISRNGGTFTLDGLQFTTPCASTWNYVVALASPGAPTLNFTNLTWPGTCTNKVALVGGAIVNGFTASPPATEITWSGNVSSSWVEPANWVGGVPPSAASDAVIPSGAEYSPRITSAVAVRNLRVESNATVQLRSEAIPGPSIQYGQLAVHGNLTIASTGTIAPSLDAATQSKVTMTGSGGTLDIAGTMNAVLVIESAVTAVRSATLGADLFVGTSGVLSPATHALTVAGNLVTRFDGRVVFPSSGSIEVRGDAIFLGSSTEGLAVAGELRVHGDLISGNTESFGGPTSPRAYRTSGTHVTRMLCNTSSPDFDVTWCSSTRRITFGNPDETQLAALVFEGPAVWAVPSVHVTGDLTLDDHAEVRQSTVLIEETTVDVDAPGPIALERLADIRRRRDSRARGEQTGRPDRGTVLREVSTISCGLKICVDGNIVGSSFESLQHQRMVLGGSVPTAMPISVEWLYLRGTNQRLPMIDNTWMEPEYTEILGSVRLAGLTADLPANAWVDVVGGSLDFEGGTLGIGPGGGFQTYDGGRVIMDTPTDLLSATFFYFYGGQSTLTAGTIRVGAELMQFTEPTAFQASGTHTVRFAADAVIDGSLYGNDFFYPWLEHAGPGESHFQNLQVGSAAPGDMYMDDVVRVDGTFSVVNGVGNLVMSGWNGTKLTTPNIDIAGVGTNVTFEALGLSILSGGTTTVLTNTTFSTFVGAFDQLEISRPSGSYSFAGIAFTTPCVDTQRYVVANGAATFNFPGVVWPGTCTEKIVTSGGATVTGFVSPP